MIRNKLISQYRGLSRKLLLGEIGLEIEVEGRNIEPLFSSYWTTKNDGSLRNGLEFVLITPVDYQKSLMIVLEEWKQHVRNMKFNNSLRTSVHVHINVSEYEELQIFNLIALNLLFENFLTKFAGKNRIGNIFCLRTKDSEGILQILRNVIENKTYFEKLTEGDLKYSALNLSAIPSQGSVEFRALSGIYDIFIIYEWITQLRQLVHKSLDFKNPKEIFKQATKKPEELISNILTPYFMNFAASQHHNIKNLMEEGLPYLVELAYMDSWIIGQDKKNKKKNNPIEILHEEIGINELNLNNLWNDEFNNNG